MMGWQWEGGLKFEAEDLEKTSQRSWHRGCTLERKVWIDGRVGADNPG